MEVILGSTLGERVVSKLCRTIQDPKTVVVFDRFFSSVRLFSTLDYPAVGTYMNTRVNTHKFTKKLAKGESECFANNLGTVAIKWHDTKEVHLMSSCHKDQIGTATRKQKDGTKLNVTCPDAFIFYNMFMGGVECR